MAKVIQRVFELKDRFTPGMEKIKRSQWQYKKDVRDMKRAGNKTFRSLRRGMIALSAATAGVGAGMTAIVAKTANAGDEVDKMSQRVGMSRQAYQEWNHVLDQNGVSQSAFERATKNSTKAMVQASQGNARAIETFDKLGVSIRNTEGDLKSQEQIFEDTIHALSEYEEGAERTAMAQQLLGENAGREFAALINSGTDSIEELKKEAHELGIVLSDSAIDNSVKFNDQLDRLRKVGTGAFRQLGVVALPWFTSGIEWIMDKLPVVRNYASQSFGYISSILEDNRERFASVKNVFIDVKNSMLDTFSSGGEGGSALSWFANTGVPAAVGGIARVLEIASNTYFFFRDNWSLISPLIYGIVGAMGAYYAITKTMTIAKYGMTAAQMALNAAMNMSPIGWVIMGIGALVTAGLFLIKNWDDVTLAGKNMWNAIVGFAEWGVNAFLGHVDGMIQGALKGINFLIDQANKIPGVDIGNVEAGIGNVDLGMAKFDTEGQSYNWGGSRDNVSPDEPNFEELLHNIDKEQEIKVKAQQASNDNLAHELHENTEALKSTRGGGNTINITVNGSDLTAEEIADKLVPRLERKAFA